MGIYLNPRNRSFWESVHSEIYVDKTELIACTNGLNRDGERVYEPGEAKTQLLEKGLSEENIRRHGFTFQRKKVLTR